MSFFQYVNIQDQTTPAFDLFFSQALGAPTTSTAATSIDSRGARGSIIILKIEQWIIQKDLKEK